MRRTSSWLLIPALAALGTVAAGFTFPSLALLPISLINPRFTPVQLLETSTQVAVVTIGPMDDKQTIPVTGQRSIKGPPLAMTKLEADKAKPYFARLLSLMPTGATASGIVCIGSLDANGPANAGPAANGKIGAILIGSTWHVLAGDPAAPDMELNTLGLETVWNGHSELLERAFAWTLADPQRARFPASSGTRWKSIAKAGTLPAVPTRLMHLPARGDLPASVLALASGGDSLIALGASGPSGVTPLPTKSSHACLIDDGAGLVVSDGTTINAWKRTAQGFAVEAAPIATLANVSSLHLLTGGATPTIVAATPEGPRAYTRQAGAWAATPVPAMPAAMLSEAGRLGPAVVTDTDDDGRADLVQIAAQGLIVWKRGTDGALAAPTWGARGGVLDNPQRLLVADFSGAGRADLLVYSDERCQLLRNLGGTYVTAIDDAGEVQTKTSGSFSDALATDFDNDGRTDIVLIDRKSIPSFFFNRGFCSFGTTLEIDALKTVTGKPAEFPENLNHEKTGGAGSALIADLTGDGAADFMLASNDRALWYILADSDGQRPSLTISAPAGLTQPVLVSAAEGKRTLGARLLEPGGSVVFSLEQKGPIALTWTTPTGPGKRTVPLTKPTTITLPTTP